MGVESARHDAIFQNNWGLQPNWCYAYKIDCQFIVLTLRMMEVIHRPVPC